nr:hypothetical protein BaRGS_022610 [Batillaria attramentaria]
MVCIIDDREDVWNFAPNLVHVKPYRFFQGTADINAPPGLTKMENDDVPITHKVIDHHHSGGEEQPKNSSENEKEKQAPDKSDEEKGDRDASTAAGADLGGGDGDVVHKTDDLSSSNGKDGLKAESLDSPSQVAEAQTGECKMELSDSIPGVSEAQTGEFVVKSEEESPAGDKEKTEISEGTENDAELREKDRREKELADDLRVSSESESDSESSNLNKEGASLKGDNSHTDQTKDANSKLLVSENKEPSDCDKAGDHADQTVNNGNVQKSPDHTGSSGSDGASTQQAESLSGKMEGSSTDAGEKNETDGRDVKKDGGDAGQASGGGDTVGAAADEGEAKDDEIEWDDEDDYLLHLEEILSRIHKAFYSMYDEGRERNSDQSRDASPSTADPSSRSSAGSASGGSPSDTTSSENTTKKLPDLKSIIPYVKRKTLKGCNVVFSGLVPLNIPVEKSRAYIVAKALGAAVQPEIVGPKDVSDKSKATTHLVAQKPGTSKHKTALRTRGIHIVNSGWLWACAERWERCDELLFPLGRDAKEESESPKKHKPRRGGRKRKSLDRDEEEGEDEEDSAGSEQKKQKRQDEEGDVEEGEMMQESSEAGADQISEGEMSLLSEKSATSTLNPLLSFSDEDLECMDKEVDELLAEEASDSSDETEGERNERMRKTVLGDQKDTESSSDSLSGEFPRGWGLRRKSSPPQTEDDLDKQKRKEVEVETEDTENEMISFQKTVDAFAPDSESNTSFAESIGSVDDEIADAVEKEFLASL